VPDDLHVDQDTLRRGGGDLYQVAVSLAERWQQFATEVQGMGDIFGTDPVGGLLGAGHQAAMQTAGKSLGTVAQAFGDFGSGLVMMADAYDDTEQTNTGHFQRLHAALG
jgi:hypothetical protein